MLLRRYRLIYELPGVELATSNFKTGLIRAYIDPEKTSRAKLEEALKKGASTSCRKSSERVAILSKT